VYKWFHVAHHPVLSCTLSLALSAALLTVGPCLSHVLRCPLPVFYCPPSAPVSHGVRCLSPVPRRISSRCTCCVASRLLHAARCLRVRAPACVRACW
jgi:hypothetical protein